jgi:hypothetical protein
MTYRSSSAPLSSPPLPYLRAAIGGVDPLSGFAIAPDIPPKKLQGVLAYAQPAQGEIPLLLVDSSVMGSGKAGMLLTDRAVYFDDPRARVPLEAVVYPPTAPSNSGEHRDGTLPTVMGPVPLPAMSESSAVAMRRALRAVAFYNRGGSRFAYGTTPVLGPVGELAAQVLRHEKLLAAPCVPTSAVHTAANIGATWLDHDAGEELLVLVDETVSEDGSRFIALTDRRVIAHGDTPVDLPYAQLAEATVRSGMLVTDLVLAGPAGRVSLATIAPAAAMRLVTDFLARVCTLPPPHRLAWPGPAPEADDPSGAVAALRAMPWPDLRVATLLEIVYASVAQGAMPVESARDLVTRATRLQRTLRGGHGRTGPAMRTPLGAADLEYALAMVLGAPMQQGHEHGARVLKWRIDGGKGSAAGTIASNVVGLTLLAVVGVGWVSAGGRAPVVAFARIWESPGGASFALLDEQGQALAATAPKIAAGVLTSLAEVSATMLFRRALYGWNVAPHALVAEPDAALDARARALVPHADVGLFGAQ